MNNKVTFPELVEQVAQYANTSKRMSELFLKELFATISQSLIDGESVKVKGIGTFKLTEVSPRKSVDVNTGEEIEIPGHKKLSFAPDKDMAEAINQPFMHFETEILDDDVTDDQLAAIDAGVPTEAPAADIPAEEEADDTATAEAPAAESPVATEEEVVMPPVFVAPVEEPEPEEAEEAEAEAPVEPSEEVPAEEETPAEVPAQEPTDEPEEAVSEEESEIEEESEPEAVAEPEAEAEVAEAEGEPEGEAESEMVSEELADERVGQEIDKRRITRRSLLEGFVVGVVTTLIVTLFAYRLYLMKGYEATPADEEPFTEHVSTDSVATPEQALVENSTEAEQQKAAEEQKKAEEEKKKAEEEKKKAEEEKQKAEAAKSTTANVAAGTTDTIKPGTNLYRMSRKHYGSDKFWVYIYEENKAKYPNPNTIPVGAVLHIPQLEKYGAKAGDPASIAAAKKKQGEIFNHLNKKK